MPSSGQELAHEPALPPEAVPRSIDNLVADTEKEGGLADVLTAAKSTATSKAPLRRDQVSNAVAFLSNPKVVVRINAYLYISAQVCRFSNA